MSNLSTESHTIPKHIAIIMDGNSRWAKKNDLTRTQGHLQGTKTVKTILTKAAHLGVRYLTLYAFSSENWKRPEWEVTAIMKIFVQKINEELSSLQENKVRLCVIGDLNRLPKKIKEKLLLAIEKTQNNDGIQLILAISYGSQQEITYACQTIAEKVKNNTLQLNEINVNTFSQHLYNPDVPEPDLLIRTGGFHRLSNYLLWQLAYSEIYFTPTLWPDFNEEDLEKAILFYKNTERKFGNSSNTF